MFITDNGAAHMEKKYVIIMAIAMTMLLSSFAISYLGNEEADADRTYTLGAGVWDGTVASAFAGGDGSSDHPYVIETAAQLAYLTQVVNSNADDTDNGGKFNSSAKYYKLGEDIYLNDTSGWTSWDENTTGLNDWTPIGSYVSQSTNFVANFNGNGFAVKGIYINSAASVQGLFGWVTGGKIYDLGVEQSFIYSTRSSGNDAYVGGIAGSLNSGSIITNCYNAGTVTSIGNSIGGIAGSLNSGSIKDCYNLGDVTGGSQVGGIVGYIFGGGSVTGCYNEGTVACSSSGGGIAGNSANTIDGCYNSGSINASGGNVGGIVGYLVGNVINCHNTGSVTSIGHKVGGIVGIIQGNSSTSTNNGNVTNCYNKGDITGGGDTGGVVGSDNGNYKCTVVNCYNTGNVTGTGGGTYAGGVIGHVYGDGTGSYVTNTVANCYNAGTVSGATGSGGVEGGSSVADHCYFLKTNDVNSTLSVGAGIETFDDDGNLSGGGTLLAALNNWVDAPTVAARSGVVYEHWINASFPVFGTEPAGDDPGDSGGPDNGDDPGSNVMLYAAIILLVIIAAAITIVVLKKKGVI
ncbi:MAG: hypothetical protein FWG19_02230 [Methanomassiliicoccaceae archaeon]|nr:hypothetical protein [Methanomassiliicoccaceae archaeon]